MSKEATTELTDFLYDVLNNTMDAILNARIDQERRYFELIEDTLLSAEEFIEKYDLRYELTRNLEGELIPPTEFESMLLEIYQERLKTISNLLEEGPPKMKVHEGNLNVKLAFAVEDSNQSQEENQNLNTSLGALGSAKASHSLQNRKLIHSNVKSLTQLKLDRINQTKQLHRLDKRKLLIRLPNQEKDVETNGNLYSEISIKFSVE